MAEPEASVAVAVQERGRPLLATLGIAAAIVLLTVFGFTLHTQKRAAALNHQYARSVAHIAKQVELKLESHILVHQNLVPLASGDLLASDAFAELVLARRQHAAAQQADLIAEERLGAATERLRTAETTAAATEDILSHAKTMAQSLLGTSEEGMKASLEGVAAAETSRKEADDALFRSRDAAQRARQAAAETAAIATEYRDALERRHAAQKGAGYGGPAQPIQDLTRSAEQARERAKDAARRVAEAEAEAATAFQAAEFADDLAEVKLSSAATRVSEALLAEGDAEAAAATLVQEQARRTEVAGARERWRRENAKLDRKEQHLAAAIEGADHPDQARDRWLDDLANKIVSAAPPSYEAKLTACLSNLSEDPVGCLFHELLEANGISRNTAEFVRCPPSQTTPSTPRLTTDGQSILFPLFARDEDSGGCAKIALSEILAFESVAPWPAAREVVVIGRNGAILWSSPESQIRLESLPGFDPARVLTSTVLQNQEIGTERFRVFMQPVSTRLLPPCEGDACAANGGQKPQVSLVVCALVPERHITSLSHEINPIAFLSAAFVLGLAILAVPLAKVWSLGKYSPFSKFDVAMLISSAGLATLMTVVFAWSFVAHLRLFAALDEHLDRVGHELEKLLTHVDSAANENLDAFAKQSDALRLASANHQLGQRCGRDGGNEDVGRWPGFSSSGSVEFCERTQATLGTNRAFDWRQIAWADLAGNQRIKVSSTAHATVPVNVAHREYFRRSLDQDNPCAQGSPRARKATEVVRSSTTGETVIVVAKPTCRDGTMDGVAHVTTNTDFLQRFPMPRAFELVIIDGAGKVMLHSDSELNHGHSFFEDLDDASELQRLVEAGVEGFVSVRYLETRVRIHVAPLPGSEWFVLTLAPESLVERAVTSMVMLGLTACGVLFGIEFTVLVIALLWYNLLRVGSDRPHPGLRIFGPDANQGLGYTAWGSLGIAASITAIVISLAWPGRGSWFLIQLLVVVSIKFLFSWRFGWATRVRNRMLQRLRSRVSSAHLSWSWLHRFKAAVKALPVSMTYGIWCAGVACVFYVCPTTVILGAAYDHIIDNTSRADQVHCLPHAFNRDTAALDICLPHVVAPAPATPSTAREPTSAVASVSETSWTLPHLIDLLPGSAAGRDSGGFLYRIDDDPIAHTLRAWTRSSSRTLALTARTHDGRVTSLASELPRPYQLRGHGLRLIAFALCFVLFFTVSFAVFAHTLRRLFFLDLLDRCAHVDGDPPSGAPFAWEQLSPDEQYVLARIAVQGVATPHPELTTAMGKLVERGILDRATLGIANPYVAQDVEQNRATTDVLSPARSGNTWDAIKAPLATGIVALAAALGMSDPQLAAAGFVAPTLIAGLPALLRALSTIAAASTIRGITRR